MFQLKTNLLSSKTLVIQMMIPFALVIAIDINRPVLKACFLGLDISINSVAHSAATSLYGKSGDFNLLFIKYLL